MDNKNCINCGANYNSADFIETENEDEVDGEVITKKVLICNKCYFGSED